MSEPVAEGLDLALGESRVMPPRGRRVDEEASAFPPRLRRANRARRKSAPAVRGDVVQHTLDTVGAERTFVATDSRVLGVRRQITVTQLAVGPQFEHLPRRLAALAANELVPAFTRPQHRTSTLSVGG